MTRMHHNPSRKDKACTLPGMESYEMTCSLIFLLLMIKEAGISLFEKKKKDHSGDTVNSLFASF